MAKTIALVEKTHLIAVV